MTRNIYVDEYLGTGTLAGLPRGHWIDGAEHDRAERIESHDPGTGRAFADFAAGGAEEVELAVAAAARAFEIWRRTKPAERCRILNRAAILLRRDADRLAVLETLDSGKTLAEAMGDVANSARLFEYYAGHADKLEGASVPLGPDLMSWTLREPVGVTAHIVPWNYPTSTFVRGVAPALAAGCVVVAKPAETTPFTALAIARLLHEAGVPPGAVNVVTGYGPAAGAPLVAHPGVRHVTFTGSVATGVRVMQAVAPNVTRLTLELGGKSPLIALADCDVEAAADGAVWAIFSNAGQICSAGSRLIVRREIKDRLLELVLRKTAALTVGHGLKGHDIGAINSAQQLGKIAGHVEAARGRGRRILAGGYVVEAGGGWFYAPTIIDDLAVNDPTVQEEIFGPVLAVQVVDSDEEALAAANATEFALIAGIYTRDIGRALRMAREVDAGQVSINDYWAGGIELPFGGNRKSGFGREKGREGLDAYLRTKAITVRL